MVVNLPMQCGHSQVISSSSLPIWLLLLLTTAQSKRPSPEDLISPLLEKYHPTPPPIPTPPIEDLDDKVKALKDKVAEESESNSVNQIHGAYERGYMIHKRSRDKLTSEIEALKGSKANMDAMVVSGKQQVEKLAEEYARKMQEKAAKEAADAFELNKRLRAQAEKRKAKMEKDLFDSFTAAQKEADAKRKLQQAKLQKQQQDAEAESARVAAALKAQEDALEAMKTQADKEKEQYDAMDLQERAEHRDDRRIAKQAKDMLKKSKMKNTLKKLRKIMGGGFGVSGLVEEQQQYQMGPDGKPLLGPDGQPIPANQAYELGPDGKPLLGPDGRPILKGAPKEGGAVNPDALAAAMKQMASLVFGDDPAAMAEAMRRIDDQKKLAAKLGPMENERRDERQQLALLMKDESYVRSKVMENLATSDFFDPGMRVGVE